MGIKIAAKQSDENRSYWNLVIFSSHPIRYFHRQSEYDINFKFRIREFLWTFDLWITFHGFVKSLDSHCSALTITDLQVVARYNALICCLALCLTTSLGIIFKLINSYLAYITC